MKKIGIRQPYIVSISQAGQIGSKIELRFRKKGQSYQTNPDYVMVKPVPSVNNFANRYDISPIAREFVSAVAPTTVANGEESTAIWTYCEIKRFTQTGANSFNLLTTEEVVFLNAFVPETTANIVPLFDTNINIQRFAGKPIYVNFWLVPATYSIEYITNGTVTNENLVVTSEGVYKVEIKGEFNTLNIFTVKSTLVCETKYTPQLVTFINRFGGWQFMTFFKAKSETFESKKEVYKMLDRKRTTFNHEAKESVRVNTGFVPENYNNIIKDLMVSKKVLLEGQDVTVDMNSLQLKSATVDKLISYELEFQKALDFIYE